MLDAIGIVSSDLNKSLSFYKHFDLTFTAFGEDAQHYESTLSSGIRIMLDSEKLMKEINPSYVKPSSFGITLGFKKESPQLVDKLANDLKESGYKITKEPWDAFWGQRYACVLDPDGNQIDIFAELKKG